MITLDRSHWRPVHLACGGMLVLALLTAGCTSTARKGPEPRELSMAEFSQPAAAEVGESAEPAPEIQPTPNGAAEPGSSLEAAGPDWTAPLPDDSIPPMQPGDRLIVDSMVGQVNGRPIYADDFFVPIEDELIQLGRRTTEREFAAEAAELIMVELQMVVQNALILAEAEASLTPEQQVGIRAFLRQIGEQVTADYGGTESEARSKLAAEGKTFEEELEGIKDRQLIMKLWQEKITPRVIVSWRDIQRAYERNYEEFNPPAHMTLARIRIATGSGAETIEQVKQRLAAGEDFMAVAESLDSPSCGIWQTFRVGRAGETFTNAVMLEKINALHAQGETTDPFELGTSTWWLHLAVLDQPPGRSLYDPEVQRQLAQYIQNVRGSEEQQRYISSLLEKGIFDELTGMGQRLLAIAILRYGP